MKKFITLITVFFFAKNLAAQPVTFIKNFGTAGDESGVKVIEDFNSDLLVTGMSNGFPFLLKTDMNGNQIFFKTYFIDSVYVFDLVQVSDSGYVIVGLKGVSDFILKTNSAGDTLWTKTYHSSVYGEKLNTVIETKDHNLWVGGNLFIGGMVCCQGYYYKTDSAGNKITPGIFTGGYGFFYDLLLAEDSTFIVSYGEVNMGPPTLHLRKCKTTTGSQVWDKNLALYAQSWNLLKTVSGEYAILGNAIAAPVGDFVMKHDTAGTVQWTKYYDDTYKWLTAATTDCDSGFAITQITVPYPADTLSDIYLVFADANGDSATSKSFAYPLDDEAHSIIHTADSGFVFTGFTTSFGNGGKDILLVRTDCNGNAVGIKDQDVNDQNPVTVFPNPFISDLTMKFHHPQTNPVELKITNPLGETLFETVEKEGSFTKTFQLNQFDSGIYFLEVVSKDKRTTTKIVKL